MSHGLILSNAQQNDSNDCKKFHKVSSTTIQRELCNHHSSFNHHWRDERDSFRGITLYHAVQQCMLRVWDFTLYFQYN